MDSKGCDDWSEDKRNERRICKNFVGGVTIEKGNDDKAKMKSRWLSEGDTNSVFFIFVGVIGKEGMRSPKEKKKTGLLSQIKILFKRNWLASLKNHMRRMKQVDGAMIDQSNKTSSKKGHHIYRKWYQWTI